MTPAGPPAAFDTADFDTVILAGGRAARMGGADKPGLRVGGTPMLVSVAQAAAAAGTRQLIIVGPPRPGAVQAGLETLAAALPGRLTFVCEEPPGCGPVAGLRRGLAEVAAPWLALLAADLPFLTGAHVAALLAAGHAGGSPAAGAGGAAMDPADDAAGAGGSASHGAVLIDDAGRPQWLVGCWQARTLRLELAGYDGTSLHGLLAPLQPVPLPPALLSPARASPARARLAETAHGAAPWVDCDTLDDLAAARRAWLARADDPAG